jgi:hypothetical protein
MMDPIIDVITDAGTSNDTNFTIGDAPAIITSLSPSSWSSPSSSFPLIIAGTGFGTSPTVSITDPNNAVSVGNWSVLPDGTIQVGVTVNGNAQPGDVASVTVTPAGLINGAMGYYPGSPSDPPSGTSQPATANIMPPGCPTSIVISNTISQPLSNDFPSFLTGVGILTSMTVGPSNGNFSSIQITENVTPTGNSCPTSIQQYTNFPTITDSSSGTFSLGATAVWEGNSYTSVTNSFYDAHIFKSTTNIIGLSNVTSCRSTATQVYKCNGQPLGEFFLTGQFASGTINGQPVTNVTVTKQ